MHSSQQLIHSFIHSSSTYLHTLLLVGLPNVGKSSLTNLLAGANHAEAANYPFCTIDPNVVQCVVPDQKFRYLVDVWKSTSVVPAMLKVTDIAGLIRGASEGAGLGNAFLSHIAAVDGIFHLIRAFESDEVIHVDDSVDPVRDLETIQGELCAKDKETLSKVMDKERERVRKEKGLARAADVPIAESFLDAFAKCEKLINDNIPIQTHEDFSIAEVECIKDWGLITTKPMWSTCRKRISFAKVANFFRKSVNGYKSTEAVKLSPFRASLKKRCKVCKRIRSNKKVRLCSNAHQ